MTVERGLRAMGGGFVLLSLGLGYWVHPGFYIFTAFVGANLLQSAFTNWCPGVPILRKLGLTDVEGRGCCGGGAKDGCCEGEGKEERGGCCGGQT